MMFQYLANNEEVNYNETNDAMAKEDHRVSTTMFYQQSVCDFGNNYQSLEKLPISCSKIQVIAKELKLQESSRGLGNADIKPHSTPATLLWLGKNYELAEGICIPRNTLYSHYIHFCKSNAMSPLNSASFGKIIRQAFPSLTTRRLGTRGQSRYHYYGIAIKESSPYYDIAFSKMSFNWYDGENLDQNNGERPREREVKNDKRQQELTHQCLLFLRKTWFLLLKSKITFWPSQRVLNATIQPFVVLISFFAFLSSKLFICQDRENVTECLSLEKKALFENLKYKWRQIGIAVSFTKNKEVLKLWPQFPNMKDISFPPHVSQEKVSSFIIMYHTHCQRIFDIIVRGTLEDAYQFLEHFWQGVPSHLSDLLNTNTVVNMVGVCDSILYRTISSVLMPSILTNCSENLIYMIRNFADKLENWINSALCDVPPNLKSVKLKLGKKFCSTLRRQIILYQLMRTAQVVLSNCDMMNHINEDWKKINLRPITSQASLFTESSNDHLENIKHISAYWENFQEMVERQAAVEDFTKKVEDLVHCCVVEISKRKQIPLRKVARSFMLLWHVIESLISRDMTIHSAASFGSFHLIQTMFDEYLHYLVEMLHSEDVTKYLLKNVTLDVLPDLDSNWNEFHECFDIVENNSNLRSISDLSGESLEIESEFPTTSLSFYSNGTDFNFSRVNTAQTDCSFLNSSGEYQNNEKEDLGVKYNSSDSFSENIQLSDFSSCDQECVEFSAGVYCQEAIEFSEQNIHYQSGHFNEGSNFECLQ